MTGTYLADAFATHKVEAMVKLLGLDPLDAEQWDFLQSETTQDLQAARGSGKTTLIGLKLSLMAEAWTSTTRGVCVLSHTNTAKNEITDRVASLAAGRHLLRYPHFHRHHPVFRAHLPRAAGRAGQGRRGPVRRRRGLRDRSDPAPATP
ncbi:hypothetical protein [Streptomyces scabiei]|uniref:hypothetical protein n=1 Tax=Streptomyces scabiei TaxID=1930 RepID=UPI000B246C95|nr:hypothetical protein [Streptomyces scabiei]